MAQETAKGELAQELLVQKIDDLNLKLSAAEEYKKYGLILGVVMLFVRIIKK